MSRRELNYFDTVTTGTTAWVGGTTLWSSGILSADNSQPSCWLSAIPLGTGGGQRTTNAIVVKSIQYRLLVTPDAAHNSWDHIRIIIFADEECDGVYPAVADLLVAPALNAGIASGGGGMCSPLNPSYFGRWKIFEDKTLSLSSGYAAAQLPQNHHEFYKEINHTIRWDNTNANAIANARRGHIFMAIFYVGQAADTGGGIIAQDLTNPPGIQMVTRLRYYPEPGP